MIRVYRRGSSSERPCGELQAKDCEKACTDRRGGPAGGRMHVRDCVTRALCGLFQMVGFDPRASRISELLQS